MDDKEIRARLDALRKELNALHAAIPDRLEGWDGLELKIGKMTYTADGAFWFKVEGKLPGGRSKEAGDYALIVEHTAMQRGHWDKAKGTFVHEAGKKLPPLGTSLIYKGKRITVVGGRLRAKFNVVVSHEDGRKSCFKADDVARLWAKQQGAKP
jgi:hypothetical protein